MHIDYLFTSIRYHPLMAEERIRHEVTKNIILVRKICFCKLEVAEYYVFCTVIVLPLFKYERKFMGKFF